MSVTHNNSSKSTGSHRLAYGHITEIAVGLRPSFLLWTIYVYITLKKNLCIRSRKNNRIMVSKIIARHASSVCTFQTSSLARKIKNFESNPHHTIALQGIQCGKFILLCQRFTPCQLCKDNIPIVLPLFLMLLHAKNIWSHLLYKCFPVWSGM